MTLLDISLLLLGSALLGGGGWLWLYKTTEQTPEREPRRERVTLKQLASACWLRPETNIPCRRAGALTDIYALRDYWREPNGRFSSWYLPNWTHTPAAEFYKDYLCGNAQLTKATYARGVILHLLEMLDQEHPVPSVSSPVNPAWAMQKKAPSNAIGYDEHKYAALQTITLLEHTLNVAGFLVEELQRNRQEFLVPKALVAALAHDIGKLPSIRQRDEMRGLSHPMRSAKLLEEMEGFDRISARAEILAAVENHHRTGNAEYLVTLLRSVDHRMRDAEYASVIKAGKGREEPPGWQARTPREEERAGQGVAAKPLPMPLPECEEDIHVVIEDGLADEKYPKVLAWVKRTELAVYSAPLIAKEFAIGRARAEVIYQTLVNQGHLNENGTVEPAADIPELPAELIQTQEPVVFEAEPARGGEVANAEVETGSMEVDCPYNPFMLTKRGRMTSVIFETDQARVSEPDHDTAVAVPLPGTEWFRADELLRQLACRLNVDITRTKADGTRTKPFFHGVTTRSGHAYFRVQCIKELLAEQLDRHPQLAAVKNILLCGETQSASADMRSKILMSVVKALVDAGHVDSSYFRPGGYSVQCAVITQAGQQFDQHFIPFFSRGFGEPTRLEERKHGQHAISQVIDIKPMTAIKAQGKESVHG